MTHLRLGRKIVRPVTMKFNFTRLPFINTINEGENKMVDSHRIALICQ